jgi:AraC-like DNA-binding protein
MAVAAPFQHHSFTVERADAIFFTASPVELARRAERLSGGAFLSRGFLDVSDPAPTPASQALARELKGAIGASVFSVDPQFGALAASGYDDILLNLLAATLCPGIVEMRPRGETPNAILARRARDRLHAGAIAALDFSQLAADLGVSLRTLQWNFRRAYGLSPRAYLYQRRLELAREGLLAAEPNTTVTDIALACGFGDLSVFSAKYRQTYGELPSQTLWTAKKR